MPTSKVLESVLPHDFGKWLLRRLGIYVSAALLTGFAFLAIAFVQANTDNFWSGPVLGTCLGLIATLIAFLTSQRIVLPDARRATNMYIPVVLVRKTRFETVIPDIDRATMAQIIVLMLQLKAAGFNEDAIQKIIDQLRARVSR